MLSVSIQKVIYTGKYLYEKRRKTLELKNPKWQFQFYAVTGWPAALVSFWVSSGAKFF
jgi:hypothetical protein